MGGEPPRKAGRTATGTRASALPRILQRVVPKLLSSPQLTGALRQRSKFEGWLKVELSAALEKKGLRVVLEHEYAGKDSEKYRADLAVLAERSQIVLIMLKTVNTNFRFAEVEARHRPITRNIAGVVQDIEKLKNAQEDTEGLVFFAVFPVANSTTRREEQLRRYLDRVVHTGAAIVASDCVSRGRDWGIAWYLVRVRGRQ